MKYTCHGEMLVYFILSLYIVLHIDQIIKVFDMLPADGQFLYIFLSRLGFSLKV